MTQLHSGLDYTLYRIYVWGGLAALVVYCLVVALVSGGDGELSITTFAGPLTLWFGGILAYWWWVFLFKGRKEMEERARQRPEGTPGIEALKSWSRLNGAMALHGGDAEALIKMERAALIPLLVWYGTANGLVVWIFGCLWMGWLGILPTAPNLGIPADPYFPIMVGGIFVWIAFMVVGGPLLAARSGAASEAAYLAPLGLAMVESPPAEPPVLEGAAILEGSRRGRAVRIETLHRQSRTTVGAGVPPFRVESRDGKLVAGEGAPSGVVEALRGLRKAKRWRGVQVTGGPEGLVVERESRGQNMWLYDLWLAEVLLEGLAAVS